jgi:hypothetical protein
MSQAPRVDFIVVGVQKAGTTALFDYLADEPVALSDVKEVHFFDDEDQNWADPDYGAYHAHFPPPDGRPCGEATPIYAYWPHAIERIAAYNPAMKLVLMLRDPVERAWSHWRMERARGVETHPFSWCIRQGRQRLFAAEPWGFHREFSYVERGFYADQIEQILALFPRDQLLILQADALRNAPSAALVQVRRFLGLAEGAAVGPRAVHVGAEDAAGLSPTDAAFLRDIYAADQSRLAALIGG